MSFINPELIFHTDRINLSDPISIKTALNVHQVFQKVIIPPFSEFSDNTRYQLILFKFHPFFDGLIWVDIIQKFGATVNIPKTILKTQRFNIKLHSENNTTSELHVLDEVSKNIVKLPVTIDNGEFYTKL